MPKELWPSYVLPDERSFFDLIDFTLNFAERVKFFDHTGLAVDHWKSFLLTDYLFIITAVSAQDISHYKKQHEEYSLAAQIAKGTSKKSLFQKATTNLLALVKNLKDWETMLADSGYRGAIVEELHHAHVYLEVEIRRLMPFQSTFTIGSFGLFPANTLNQSKPQWDELDELFKLFYKNVLFVQEKIAQKVDSKLAESQQHAPHIGLIIAFIRLFKEVQDQLNGLLARHLEFYLGDLLEQRDHQNKPATAYLGMEASGLTDLPADTEVEIIGPDKQSMVFKILRETPLSQAKISEIRTVYQASETPFTDEIFSDQRSVLTSLYDECLYLGEPKTAIEFEDPKRDFPVALGQELGAPGSGGREIFRSQIGFVISSPILILAEGNHQVEITLQLTPKSYQETFEFLGELMSQKFELPPEELTDSDLSSLAQSILQEGFHVSISGMEGWKRPRFSFFRLDTDTRSICLRLRLNYPDEYLVVFDEKIHGSSIGTSWPCIRLMLNHFASLPAYSIVKKLQAKEIQIETKSENIATGISASNQLGKLDISSPFQPFGPLPDYDSYFKLLSPTILNRNLKSLTLNLYWTGLPQSRQGFESWYSGYPEAVTNESFRVELLSFKKHFLNRDLAKNEKEIFHLFETKNSEHGVLEPNRHLEINVELLSPEDFPLLGTPVFAGKEPAFFLKLKEPRNMIFGHQVYPKLFAHASMPSGFFGKRKKSLPNVPYTPTLDHIDVVYSNSARENLTRTNPEEQDRIKLIHLYPFGHEEVYPGSKKGVEYLLPQFNQKGNLLIGLIGLTAGQVISLGFDLVPAFFIHSVTKGPDMLWEYLEGNEWHPMKQLILEDTTENLIHPGIVKLRIPSKMDLGNTLLPANKFWLRISNSGKTELNSRLKAVFLNAVKIQHQRLPSTSHLIQTDFPLRPVVNILGYKTVKQVFGPFGLRIYPAFDSKFHKQSRSAELMRHRSRGSTAWDIERIILEEFPEIGRVMVYGRSDYPDSIVCASNIQVVVVPVSFDPFASNQSVFRVPYGLLKDIRDHVRSYLSPHAQLEVCNPVFEKIKVRTSVVFSDSQQAGYFISKLEKELIRFLAPDPISDVRGKGFMNSISKSEIQNFIESRPYVVSISGFSVLQLIESPTYNRIIDTATSDGKIEVLRTISPYAILTSAENHHIESITKDQSHAPQSVGIGDLAIESDFIIKANDRNR
ncbi:hypothetical protein [Algoriphagus namhaensis]